MQIDLWNYLAAHDKRIAVRRTAASETPGAETRSNPCVRHQAKDEDASCG